MIGQQGFEVRNIINIKNRITKEPLPLFFVDLEPSEDNKHIYNIRYMLNTKIKIEPPKTIKQILQCTRCQSFNYKKQYCNRPYKCVKCGLQHESAS